MDDVVSVIPLAEITAGNNDRKQFDPARLLDLAASIAANGLAQPITVRPLAEGYEIVAGERRFRAHQLYTKKVAAGEWVESPHVKPGFITAIVRGMTNDQAAAIMLVENTGRQDLNPIEEASAYAARHDVYRWDWERIARVAGKSVEVVKARVALLQLDKEIQKQVAAGSIPLAYAGLMTELDTNRQLLAVRLLRAGAIALPNFRRYVMQLQEEQAQDGLFDLTTVWVAQVTEMTAGPKNGKTSLERFDLPHHPDVPACEAKYGTPIGDVMFRYVQELLGAGQVTEAAAVSEAYAALVKIKKACLPKLTIGGLTSPPPASPPLMPVVKKAGRGTTVP